MWFAYADVTPFYIPKRSWRSFPAFRMTFYRGSVCVADAAFELHGAYPQLARPQASAARAAALGYRPLRLFSRRTPKASSLALVLRTGR